MNVDAAEISKFEALPDWWNTQGSYKALHDINPLRIDFILQVLNPFEQHVLDIGCGGGILSESLANLGAVVTGIDMNQGALNEAKKHAGEQNVIIDYQHMTAEQYADMYPERFDVVTCMELLEHVPHPASIIQAAARLLKPGGHLFLSTINRTPKGFLFAIVGAEYLLRLLPMGTHRYEKFIKPSELGADLRAEGLELMQLAGLHYRPFSQRYYLDHDPSVNYLVHAQKTPCRAAGHNAIL